MIKTYKANTNISINVVLPSKKNLHITFTPLSNGSSVFTTDNEELQQSIENHYKFGKLFKLNSIYGQSVAKKTPDKSVKASLKGETTGTSTTENEDKPEGANNENAGQDEVIPGNADTGSNKTIRKVNVSDIASAKDFLADTFGISRTSMRSAKSILEQAAAHGIEFVGLS